MTTYLALDKMHHSHGYTWVQIALICDRCAERAKTPTAKTRLRMMVWEANIRAGVWEAY